MLPPRLGRPQLHQSGVVRASRQLIMIARVCQLTWLPWLVNRDDVAHIEPFPVAVSCNNMVVSLRKSWSLFEK